MALITAEQARLYVPALTGTAKDPELVTLITRADALFAHVCGYPPASTGASPTLEAATYTLYLDGPGGVELRLPVRPIQSITSIYDDTLRLYASDKEVVSGDYTSFGDDGLIILDTDGSAGTWSTGYRAIRFIGSIGFTAGSAPEDIKQAAALMAAHWFRLPTQHGKTNLSVQGISVGLRPETMPDSVRQLIAPYRNFTALLGVT